jgi:hypothetical protein
MVHRIFEMISLDGGEVKLAGTEKLSCMGEGLGEGG